MEQTFKVPIRNIFCMLSYVNGYHEFTDQLSAVDEELITYDFLAERFIKETTKLLKRGLLKDYITHAEETGFISGKMLINESLPLIAERRPVVVCEKDDYSANILLNQIMCTTLISLYKNPNIKESTRKKCFMLWEQLPEVNSIVLTREIFMRTRYQRHNVYYKPMIHLARLLFEIKLLSHKQGDWSLFAVELSDTEMNRLFEKFLFHFYRVEQKDYDVRLEKMTWNLQGNQAFLPSMLTDVTLIHRRENKRIVIDAKFYKNMFQLNFDKKSFHSHNLYQIFTYLMHQPKEDHVRGVLIYPVNNNGELTERFKWDERIKLEIYRVSLDDEWRKIRERLLEVLSDTHYDNAISKI